MRKSDLKKFKLTKDPGVYFFMKGKEILYIGKATNFSDRVKSYFSKDLIEKRGPMILDMVTQATSIKQCKTDSVLEALILESSLIKKHQPKYNTKEKDNKSFNYVCITNEDIPKVLIKRGRNLKMIQEKELSVYKNFPRFTPKGPYMDENFYKQTVPNSLYNNFPRSIYQKTFGPFPSGTQLKEAMKIIRRIFPYADEQSVKKNNSEFYLQLGLSPNIKNREIDLISYRKNIKNLVLFFQGKKKDIIKNLKKEMMSFAKNREFEKANEIKKKIFALNHINDIALIKSDTADSHSSNYRIEAYDVAHMSGKSMVGVMVVLENQELNKKEYKKFIIKTVGVANDPKALSEVLERRFSHEEWRRPDLIVVDGGMIQMNAASKVLSKLRLKIPIVSVLKDERHKAKAILGDSKIVEKNKKNILLANAESHRFAIAFHKQRRAKTFIGSI